MAGPKSPRLVPVLQVSHTEEGEDRWTPGLSGWGVYMCMGALACQACAKYVSSTYRAGVQVPVGTGWRVSTAHLSWGQQLPCHSTPTLPADQVPPEDDEFSEYSEYSVEEYQDPELPWDSEGEEGWARGAQMGPGRALSLAFC